MNLYIMTRGRVGNQITWNNLPPSLQNRTYLVCPPDEWEGHEAYGIPTRNLLIQPTWVNNYSDKFRWILQDGMADGNDKAVILDDDLTFSIPYIREDGERRLKTLAKQDLHHVKTGFDYMEYLLDDTALVSFHPRQMGHTKEPPYAENGKVVCVQGINRKMIGVVGELNRFPILADVVLNATLLSRGLGNKLITTMFLDWGSCQAPGGCSLTRTAEVQAEACYWLEERFGPYIKAVEKEAKNGWLGGKRVDFRGQWKKLHAAGVAGAVDLRT